MLFRIFGLGRWSTSTTEECAHPGVCRSRSLLSVFYLPPGINIQLCCSIDFVFGHWVPISRRLTKGWPLLSEEQHGTCAGFGVAERCVLSTTVFTAGRNSVGSWCGHLNFDCRIIFGRITAPKGKEAKGLSTTLFDVTINKGEQSCKVR